MMINDMKKNELADQEMNGVAGGVHPWQILEREMQKQEEARKKMEAVQERAMQNAAARREAIRQAEAENQPDIKIHGGGVSGGW